MSTPREFTNPFPGLRPFETEEYRLFFGREGQSDALLERLAGAHFLAVVGTSGSGKSSLVRAGLLPALRGGMMAGAGAGWRVAVLRPGHDPLGNLARALAGEGVPAGAGAGLAAAEAEAVIEATLRRGSLGLVEAARGARLGEGEKLLVVVDQFEELFRFRAARAEAGATDDDAAAFVKLLLEAARQREVPVYVVLTMRSDFLGDCSQFQGLPEAINDAQYLIPRMTRDERRFAIAGPVRVSRARISEPLVNRLLNDVGDNPDQLPILQHALMRTWDYWTLNRRGSEPLGLEHYEAVGTMSEALSLHADEAWGELPDERSRRIAEILFKSLTERGADNREIRRPTRLKEICEIAGATPEEVAAVVEVFRREGRSFLMPPAGTPLTPETVLDISHESLIRNWERLREWVRDEADAARIYRRLAEAASAHRAGEGGLLDDVTLGWVDRWREKYHPNRAWGVRYHPEFDEAIAYLEESRVARDERIAAEGERERRELEQAHAFAEQQARAASRMRRLSVALGLILLFSIGTAGYALNARADAERNRKVAEVEKGRALLAAEAANRAGQLAQKEKEAARRSEDEAVEAQKHAAAEELHAEQEAARAGEQAGIARRNAEEARAAYLAADQQRKAAEENARQVAGALGRGKLIRTGLESLRREDFQLAKDAFQKLHDELKQFQPDAPRPAGGRTFTPEQARQFVNDFGWTLSHLGDTYRKLNDFETSIERYEEARVVLEGVLQGERAAILFETYYGLAHAYHGNAARRSNPDQTAPARLKLTPQEQFAKAEEYYTKALEYQKSLAAGNPLAAVAGYRNLARLYVDIKKFKEAEDNLKRVVDAYRTFDKEFSKVVSPGEGLSGALKELAEFYRGQSRYEDAARTYNELIDLREASGKNEDEEMRALADDYSELGQIYSAMKDEKRADSAFRLADKLQQLTLKVKHKGLAGLTDGTGTTYDLDLDELGDLYLGLGRIAEAKRDYEEALNIRKVVRERQFLLATSYKKLARLYGEHGDPKVAEQYYKLLSEARKEGPEYAAAQKQLADLYANRLNNPVEAEWALLRAFSALAQRGAWKEVDAILVALAELHRRQNRDVELKLDYERRLESMGYQLDQFRGRSSRSPEIRDFMPAFIRVHGEAADFYLSQKDNQRAETAYQRLLAAVPYILGRAVEAPPLRDLASSLEKYRALLIASSMSGQAAKVEETIRAVRARQNEIEKPRP